MLTFHHAFEIRDPRFGHARRAALLLALLALAAGLPACNRQETVLPSARAATETTPQEIWDAYYMQDAKIGYGQTSIRPITRAGAPLAEITMLNHLEVTRAGQKIVQDVKMISVEKPDGELLEFTTEVSFGPVPTVTTGRVDGDDLEIETDTKGSRSKSRIAWSPEIGGFRAVEQSLEREPMSAGGKRSVKMLIPLVNQVADVELSAGDYETTSVLGVKTRLLRIDSVALLPDGKAIRSTIWTDRQGQSIKTRVDSLQTDSYRTTRELAKLPGSAAGFDLISDMIVKPDQPLTGAHKTREAHYRVELTNGDPAKVFAGGPTQSLRELAPHVAELTVRSVRPTEALPKVETAEPIDKKYTAANSVLQLDDPKVQAMAKQGKGSAAGAQETAVALERYVHRTIAKKNFSQAFATAAEVAESREGDCTEHAVLLAALARACGIPSRVAIGLVYVESAGGFGYHLWTEVYLDGSWIPLDATLGQGGIGAAHIKLTDSALDGASAYSSLLPVTQVIGQLRIKVMSIE